MLCCQSVRAGPLITYKERRFTAKEITDALVCFALSYGLKRKVQLAMRDMPAIKSNGGASRCQFITDSGGYSVTNSSANSAGFTERCLLTFSLRKSNTGGISSPFVILPLSKLYHTKACHFSIRFKSLKVEVVQFDLLNRVI